MPFIRFSASKHCAYIIAVILSLSEIMPSYSYYKEKLVYIIIAVPLGCQPSFYIKYTKLNIYLSYNVKLVFNTKYL